MLEAFILGFWMIWSANRDIHAVSESLWFTLLAVVVRQLMGFALPEIDKSWLIANGVLWVYVAAAFFIVNRFSNSLMAAMVMAAAAAIGYYQVTLHLPDWLSALSV